MTAATGTPRMTKGRAKQLAVQQLRHGHCQPTAGMAWVECPRCQRRVTVLFLPGQQPSPVLHAALQSHLVEEH